MKGKPMQLVLSNEQIHLIVDSLDFLNAGIMAAFYDDDLHGDSLEDDVAKQKEILELLAKLDIDHYWDTTLREDIDRVTKEVSGSIQVLQQTIDSFLTAHNTLTISGPDGDETIEWDS
jgi:hypothetical protein